MNFRVLISSNCRLDSSAQLGVIILELLAPQDAITRTWILRNTIVHV